MSAGNKNLILPLWPTVKVTVTIDAKEKGPAYRGTPGLKTT
jgi:hypothetical protein